MQTDIGKINPIGKAIRWGVVLLILGGIGVLIWFYTRPKPLDVMVKPVHRGTVELTVSNTRAGTVNACRRTKLSPSIGGQIAKLTVKEGDQVVSGQLLLELWNLDLKAELILAENEVDAAKARTRAVCFRSEESQRDANRLMQLRKNGAISEERTDKAQTEAKASKAECHASEASILIAQARLEVVKANIERTQLIAPFSGVIAEINGELNEFVTPSPIGVATPPAIDLIDNSCFYVEAPIDEVDAASVSVGMTARISLDAFGDRPFEGKVRRIADYVLDHEKQARTVDVEIEFVNTKDYEDLLAGYSADVEIILETHPDTLRIPTESILDGKRVFVYLHDPQVLQERIIEPGISNWDFTEVLSGISADASVVVNVDQAGVKDGAKAAIAKDNP